jgi:hypothetical protein
MKLPEHHIPGLSLRRSLAAVIAVIATLGSAAPAMALIIPSGGRCGHSVEASVDWPHVCLVQPAHPRVTR